MRGSKLGLLAAGALVAGLAGCALPQVLPVETGAITPGPSPYGAWYEQHLAANSVLLAAADQPEETIDVTGDTPVNDTPRAYTPVDDAPEAYAPEAYAPKAYTAAELNTAVEASAASATRAKDFDNSTPYQFPSSSFSPAAPEVPGGAVAPAAPGSPAAPGGGPIRY